MWFTGLVRTGIHSDGKLEQRLYPVGVRTCLLNEDNMHYELYRDLRFSD
ncbi:MAG: hypothetical protein ACSLEL_04775 [Candidatus Malihini olakiniferum]